MFRHALPRRPTLPSVIAVAAVLFGSLTTSAQSTPREGADDLRLRSGLISVASHTEIVVRVTELERLAGASQVTLLVIDRNDRVIDKIIGTAKSGSAFEVTLPASRLGNDPRELFRIDLRLTSRGTHSEPLVHVEVFDPFDLSIEERVICAGRGASGNGPIGMCTGAIVDFETP